METLKFAAKPTRRRVPFRIEAGGNSIAVEDLTGHGFKLAAQAAALARGEVDLFHGDRHIARCLVVRVPDGPGVQRYEFKRLTPVRAVQPLDYVLSEVRGIPLIEMQ